MWVNSAIEKCVEHMENILPGARGDSTEVKTFVYHVSDQVRT